MSESNIVDPKGILINLIEQFPIIYDKSREDYKDMTKKRNIWNEIASQMLLITEKEYSVNEIQNLWKQLKTQYANATYEKYIPSGSAAPEDDSTPSFEYIEDMSFLQKYNRPPQTLATYHLPRQEMVDDQEMFDDSVDHIDEETISDSDDHIDDNYRFGNCEEGIEEDKRNESMHQSDTEADLRRYEAVNDYFVVIKRYWTKVAEEKKKDCFFTLKKLIDVKIAKRS